MEEKLKQILLKNNLENYVAVFEENKILKLKVAAELNDEDFTRMGITNINDLVVLRKVLKKRISTKKLWLIISGIIVFFALSITGLYSIGFIDLTFRGIMKGLGISVLIPVILPIIILLISVYSS